MDKKTNLEAESIRNNETVATGQQSNKFQQPIPNRFLFSGFE